ncbi:hypothetical protein BH10BAC5_BH10BAC5_26180 [soil metagenome]
MKISRNETLKEEKKMVPQLIEKSKEMDIKKEPNDWKECKSWTYLPKN